MLNTALGVDKRSGEEDAGPRGKKVSAADRDTLSALKVLRDARIFIATEGRL